MVIVSQTKKTSYLMDYLRLLPILNLPYLHKVHEDASLPNPMDQEWHFDMTQDTLGLLQVQLVLPQCLKDFHQVLLVVLYVLSKHHNVI
jgi:hypothetical protein